MEIYLTAQEVNEIIGEALGLRINDMRATTTIDTDNDVKPKVLYETTGIRVCARREEDNDE
jgi:hypothetical protein